MSDPQTLAVYAAQATEYADMVAQEGALTSLVRLADRVPAGGHILDWGCGAGNSAAYLVGRGLKVTATDATPEFAAKAKETYGIDVRVETFDALDETNLFDGVWASFSLLHAPRDAMPGHLNQVYQALKPGGFFTIGLKIGTGELRDEIGRFYTYYSRDEIVDLLTAAGFTVIGEEFGDGIGLDGQMWPWIVLDTHA